MESVTSLTFLLPLVKATNNSNKLVMFMSWWGSVVVFMLSAVRPAKSMDKSLQSRYYKDVMCHDALFSVMMLLTYSYRGDKNDNRIAEKVMLNFGVALLSLLSLALVDRYGRKMLITRVVWLLSNASALHEIA